MNTLENNENMESSNPEISFSPSFIASVDMEVHILKLRYLAVTSRTENAR